MNISPKDHYRQKLMELNRIGSQWADVAKKVLKFYYLFIFFFWGLCLQLSEISLNCTT